MTTEENKLLLTKLRDNLIDGLSEFVGWDCELIVDEKLLPHINNYLAKALKPPDKLREGIERRLDELLFSPGESKDGYTYNLTGCITNLVNYFHSQVEGKLPSNPFLKSDPRWGGYERAKENMAGYVANTPSEE